MESDADCHPPPQPEPPPSPPRPSSSASPPVTASKAKSLKDRVSFSFSSRPRRPSCWGRIRMIHRVGRSRSRTGSGAPDAAPDATRTAVSSRGVGGGRTDVAAGARSLLQRNDFYCDECNTHR